MYVVISRVYECKSLTFRALVTAQTVFYIWLDIGMAPEIRDHLGNVYQS